MNKSSAQSEVPGGFEGRAGGSKGNPTPTAKSLAVYRWEALPSVWWKPWLPTHQLVKIGEIPFHAL
jgi:hypothetical protein